MSPLAWCLLGGGALLCASASAQSLSAAPRAAEPAPLPTVRASATALQPSLTLRQLFDAAIATHPSLQAIRLQARAAEQDVVATERQRWPTVSVVTETDTGSTASAATRALRVEQTLWDAGRNTSRISEAQARTQIAETQVRLQEQDIFLQIINAWQNLTNALERQRAAEQTLERLRGYQTQMQRRVEAQASPRIDLELVDARVLQTDVEWMMAKTSLQVAVTRLEQLSGLKGLAQRLTNLPAIPTYDGTSAFVEVLKNADWQLLGSQHVSVEKARHERLLVANQLLVKQAEQWPQLYLRMDKPLATTQTNQVTSTSTFAGLRYTPGAGFSTAAEAAAIATRIESQDQAIEAAAREIQQVLQNDQEEFLNARHRMVALERALEGSRQVLDSYMRQFQAGRKTWQDLLNSARDMAQTQYSLADARASLVGAMNRLQLRMNRGPELP